MWFRCLPTLLLFLMITVGCGGGGSNGSRSSTLPNGIEGTLTRAADGKRLKNASIGIREVSCPNNFCGAVEGSIRYVAVTDTQGRFRLPLKPGKYWVHYESADAIDPRLNRLVGAVGDNTTPVTVPDGKFIDVSQALTDSPNSIN